MKRLVCVLFLLILLCLGVVFEGDTINVSNKICSNSIRVISDEIMSDDYVFNGNNIISKVDNLSGVDVQKIQGVSFEVNTNIDIKNFLCEIGLHNYKEYFIDNCKIIEGKLRYKNNLNINSVQIAIKEDVIIIGFPMILNSF